MSDITKIQKKIPTCSLNRSWDYFNFYEWFFFRLHYHMTSIGFISTYFSVLPWMLICIGVVAFLVSAFGLIVSATEVKELLIGYAATMAIICIGLFGNSKAKIVNRASNDEFSIEFWMFALLFFQPKLKFWVEVPL